MPKRFSRYQFALKANRGEAQAGSPLARYKDYKSGANTVTYTRAASSLPGGFEPIYIIPFGESEDLYYLTQISGRAQDQVALVGGQAALNYLALAAAGAVDKTESNKYTPAAVTVFDPSGAPANQTSQVTGVRYKKTPGQSYTFPFGKDAGATGAAATFKTRATAIKTAAETANPANSVTFRPEILRAF